MNLILEFSVTIILFAIKAVSSELKSSLTFVIDDTASMKDEIDQVKLRTKEVFEAVLNTKNSDIDNFVLVTFNDPGVQFRVKTTHEDEFMEALDEIDVDGGLATCPEMAMTGISLGIKSSNPNSFVYVFTDASAEDYHKYDDVETLASVFSTKVTFLLTGDCKCRSCEHYKVYNKLANATGGQVFNVEKNEIKNIIDYIIDSIKTTKCLVSQRHFFSEDQRKFELRFLVDNKLNEITLSLTGDKPQLKVFFSNGTEVMTSVLVTLSETLILKMVNVVSEEYIAKVEVNGKEADLSINAACNFAFQYGFSQIPANSMDKTVYRPTSGGKEYLSIQITKQDDEVELHTAQIRDVSGNIIMNLKLSSLSEKFYVTDEFMPPNQPFKIAVVGKFKSTNEEITRVALPTIEPAKVTPVTEITTEETTSTTESSIEMAPNIDEIKIVNSDDNGKVSIECKVSSNPKPDIEWMDKHGNTFSVFDVNYDESNPIIKTSAILNTESKEDNIFKCTATNGQGTKSESIDYFSPKELPVIDKTVKEYFKNKDESIDIDCRVIKGKPRPVVTWNFKQQKNTAYVKLSSTGENLHIDNLNTDNAGFYKCVAENSVGSDEHKVEVQVTVVESTTQEMTSTTETTIEMAPNIDEIKIVNSDDNGKVSIECIVSSNPKPDIEWMDKHGNTFSVFVVNYDESNPIIKTNTVLNTESKEDNIFKCTATNGQGTKSESIDYVSPKEIPVVDKTVKEYFKNKDESTDIDCRVIKGKPKPVVTWYFKQLKNIAYVKLSSTGENLHIDNLNTDNAGFYKCVAENSVGSDEHKVEVQVTEPPQFTPKETTLIKAPATIVNLDCVVRGWPKPRVRWYFNDKEIVNGARYLIHDNHTLSFLSKPKDTGKFRCEIVGVVGNNNIIYNVEVKKFAPLFITPPQNAEIHLRIGDTKTLECNAGGVPEPTVQWNYVSFDSKTYAAINTDKSKNGNNLVLTGDDINKEGYYICNASNGREQMSITYKVFVGVPPWIVKPPNKMINAVIEDKRLHIRCEAFGNPKPTVTWQKNGADLAIGTNNLMTEGNLLIIYDVNDFTEISGKYTCIAANTVGTASEDYEVQVLRKPTIGSVQELCIEKDKPKELWCSTDFQDKYKRRDSKIVWFIKDEYFITNPFKLNGYDYEAMTYICRISYTEGGTENFAINIKLCFPPEFYNDLPTHGTYVMYSYLDCRAKGSPAPTITWYKNGKRLPDLTDTLRADDEATYRCEVTNNFITNTNHVKFREFKVIRDECVIDIKMYSSKQRPFLSKNNKFIIPITQYDVENDLIRIPGNKKISFICPNNYIKFRGRNLLVSSLQAKCKTDSQFEIKHKAIIGTSTNVYDLECSEEPKPHLRNPNIVCNYLDDYQIINVGFKLVSTFQIMYSVCFNVVTKEPTYARYEIYHFGHRTVRPYEYENSKYTNDEAEVYDCDWQRNFFIQSFGFDMCPNKCCYIRRQLVNPQDLYPSYEAAAFNNINVVPHWTSCSTNWNQIEERILAKAKINGEKFEIWTGIYDRLELESYGLIKKPVAIRNTKFMPKLLWKVVHSKILRAAIAVIQINSPNILDPKEIKDYVICPDITDNVKWMHNPDWKDPSKGYTYICGIKEFLKAFNRIIFLKGVKRTLV
ncbi:hemicentin-1-like [Colias croceus]|uniref:hemicentin-1-like n=1 Tax=Colias crocea TaxID=72248 RepID=UPI001E27EFAC|nr:hemicentin-1-like [Colias croceus]